MMLTRHWNLTERVMKILTLAEATAQSRGQDSVGPEHLALALIDEGEGVAATALQFHGFSLTSLRDDVIRLLPPATLPATAPSRLELTMEGHSVFAAAELEATAL